MTETLPDLFTTVWRRQSVRAYRPDPVPPEILTRIMAAARQSPSGGNGQGWRFGIVTDAALRQELAAAAGGQDFIAQAPVVIAFCSPLYDPSEESPFSREVNRLRWGVPLDEVVAGSAHPEAVRMLVNNASPLTPGAYIQLAAATYGLGTCWIGYLDVARAGRALGLPSDWRCHFLMPLGYPAEEPKRRPRKPLSEITFGDVWTQPWSPAVAATGDELLGAAPAAEPADPTTSAMTPSAAISMLDIISRREPPVPWEEGDNIPWNEPDFSRRMLREHLTQAHDAASRRSFIIDDQVDWLHSRLLGGKPARVLDLGCGPGLYSQRLAALGHTCTGIDFSPASIAHARHAAADAGLSIDYRLGDMRETEFGEGYDAVMFLYGEVNVFRTNQVRELLRRAYDALVWGGKLVVEITSWEGLRADAPTGHTTTWHTSAGGLFGDGPHIVLRESHWDDAGNAKMDRYFTIDATNGTAERFAATYQAYTLDEFRALLAAAGFVGIQTHDGIGNYIQSGIIGLTAVKPEWAQNMQ